MPSITDDSNIPLCVDLDGTLIASDTLIESILIHLKNQPLYAFLLPFWIIKGKKYFKSRVFGMAQPDAALLPYRNEVTEFIKNERLKNRRTYLVTASASTMAESVASYTGLFDDSFGSNEQLNLKGKEKQAFLIERFGRKSYDYIGNSNDDIPPFSSSRKAIAVNPRSSLRKKIVNANPDFLLINTPKNNLRLFIKEIRIYQWIKNLLLFFPLFLAHKVSQPELILDVLLAFLSFGFCASAVYVTNDLFDLQSDRQHPRKKKRPVASGDFPILGALIISPLLLLTGIGISIFTLPAPFTLLLITYIIVTSLYSIIFKKIYIIDIIILAGLYTLRLFAGGLAIETELSPWLLAFSTFIFLSLAIVKRYTELLVVREQNLTQTSGRGYEIGDIDLLQTLGVISGYMSILVFTFYINSQKVIELYHHPELLWAIAPLLLFWITRIWFISHRGKMHDDPIVFTAKDPISYIIGVVIIIIAIGASI